MIFLEAVCDGHIAKFCPSEVLLVGLGFGNSSHS